jgi:hypothetical protein
MEPLSEATTLPNLRSPECLARGLPQGGKPATKSVLRRTARRARGRKGERISESKLHGTVNCNSAALLMRRSLRARGQWDLHMGSSTVTANPAGLTSRVRLERAWNCRNWDMLFAAPLRLAVTEVPTYSTVQGEYTGVWRTTKDSGPSQGPG